jgi:hypothetical protein
MKRSARVSLGSDSFRDPGFVVDGERFWVSNEGRGGCEPLETRADGRGLPPSPDGGGCF